MKQHSKFLVFGLFVLGMLLLPELLDAQCAMCKAAPESNLTNGGRAGKGLNTGILYMAAVPYFIVGSLGLVWYFNRKKADQHSSDLQEPMS